MKKYLPRVVDKELDELLKIMGAVLIEGPKWCGKSTTAKQHAKSVIEFQNPDKKNEYDDINSKSEVLNSIDIPVLVVFGDIDECVLTQDITTVKNYLNNNIKKCNIQIIEGANHSYTNKYEELGNIIENNI